MSTAENKVQTPKKQAISKSYTLTQFGEMIKKLDKLGWLTETERKEIIKIREGAKAKYIGEL